MGFVESLVAGGAAAGVSVYQAEQARKAQVKGIRAQEDAQRAAKVAAAAQLRRSEEAANRANRKTPDMRAILEGEQAASTKGMSTLLTGPSGVKAAGGKLGRKTLLGEMG